MESLFRLRRAASVSWLINEAFSVQQSAVSSQQSAKKPAAIALGKAER
jgi:hypothetical protein